MSVNTGDYNYYANAQRDEYFYPKDQNLEGKTSSVPERIFKYVISGALIGAGLSIITGGIINLPILHCCFGGTPQTVRKSIVELGLIGSIKKSWNESPLDTKIILVAFGAMLCFVSALSLFTLTSISPGASAFFLLMLGSLGAVAGSLFSSQLSDPPLLDWSKYRLVKKY